MRREEKRPLSGAAARVIRSRGSSSLLEAAGRSSLPPSGSARLRVGLQ